VSTDLAIGLVLILAMIAYFVGAVMNNGSDALLGCVIPALFISAVFLGIFLLSVGPIIVVEWILNFFS
jgi:hypothetical protein